MTRTRLRTMTATNRAGSPSSLITRRPKNRLPMVWPFQSHSRSTKYSQAIRSWKNTSQPAQSSRAGSISMSFPNENSMANVTTATIRTLAKEARTFPESRGCLGSASSRSSARPSLR